MDENEQRVLSASVRFHQAVAEYLIDEKNKKAAEKALIDVIDALDIVHYARTGDSFFDIIRGESPFYRKKTILRIEKEYDLTKREGQILRYLANERNSTYIANALKLSQATVKAHRYAIYKKLGIHSRKELQQLFKAYEQSTATEKSPSPQHLERPKNAHRRSLRHPDLSLPYRSGEDLDLQH